MHDQDSIGLTDYNGQEYRLKVKELYKLINDLVFIVRKKRKYLYLEIDTEEFEKILIPEN